MLIARSWAIWVQNACGHWRNSYGLRAASWVDFVVIISVVTIIVLTHQMLKWIQEDQSQRVRPYLERRAGDRWHFIGNEVTITLDLQFVRA